MTNHPTLLPMTPDLRFQNLNQATVQHIIPGILLEAVLGQKSTSSVDIRTKKYDNLDMNGNELLKKLRKLAKEKNKILRQEKHRGKGSHSTLYYGDKKTVLKDRTKEIGPGLLNSMLKNLGLTKDDIE